MPTLNVALYEPEIPPNTGNIIRLCANCGAQLHLIHPLGFALEEKSLRRAGLDYREWANIKQYKNFTEFLQENYGNRIIACTTKTDKFHTDISYKENDILLFGPESRGLPEDIRVGSHERIRIPMQSNSRSINISNAVSIIAYEAWRQQNFIGGA